MNSEKKNICIAGCGTIGSLHAKNLSDTSNLTFFSRTHRSAETLNRKFLGDGTFTKFEEVLSSQKIDGVVIASPPEYHKDQVISAIHAGKFVLVEKPMCVSLKELEEIENAVNGNQHRLMVAENYYYKPSLKAIKTLLEENRIGEITGLSVRKEFTQPAAGWRKKYGALLEGGIHFIALISDILDRSPLSVEAEFPATDTSAPDTSAPERTSVIKLSYDESILAVLRYSWDTASLTKGIFQHSSICGTQGKIVFESNGIYVVTGAGVNRKLSIPGLSDISGHKAMTRDFLECLNNPAKNPYSNISKTKRDLAIVFDAYRQGGIH